jgi:hypothetical protein
MFHQFSQLNTNYFSSATRRGLRRLFFDNNTTPKKVDSAKLENSYSEKPSEDVEDEKQTLFPTPSLFTPSPSFNYTPDIQKNPSPIFSAKPKSSFTPIKLNSFKPTSRAVLV